MLHNALHILRTIERALLGALMLAMSLAYVVNVVARNLLPALAPQLAWIEEATLIALAWVVFLGLGLALERGRHIAMSALLERIRGPAKAWIIAAINLVGLLFSLYIAKIGMDISVFVYRSGQVSPTLNLSMIWLYGVMPVGFGLLALRYALELAGYTRRFDLAREPAA
jgi:TRAP-type C4-dicarboxylate transport system permease small subunit